MSSINIFCVCFRCSGLTSNPFPQIHSVRPDSTHLFLQISLSRISSGLLFPQRCHLPRCNMSSIIYTRLSLTAHFLFWAVTPNISGGQLSSQVGKRSLILKNQGRLYFGWLCRRPHLLPHKPLWRYESCQREQYPNEKAQKETQFFLRSLKESVIFHSSIYSTLILPLSKWALS